jgi:hypothetical protein
MGEIDEHVRPDTYLAAECGPWGWIGGLKRHCTHAVIGLPVCQRGARSGGVDAQIEQIVG